MAAGIIDLVSDLVQLSTSEDEQNSEDDITSSASPKSTPQSEQGKMDSSSSTSAATDTSTRTGPSLLSVLQQAKPSDLSRKRVIRSNLPPKGKYIIARLYRSIPHAAV